MKLLRYEQDGTACLGVLRGEMIAPLHSLRDSYPTMMSIVSGGDAAIEALTRSLDGIEATVALAGARLLAPIERPGKYLAIGMNYKKHQEEVLKIGLQKPKQQLWFNKQTSCISGPFDDIDPGVTAKLDYEVELGVVIGRPAKRIREEDARGHIFGYFVANDVTARDWQAHSPTFTLGKSFDTHGPIGPWIVTADEIADPHDLDLRCLVNDVVRQDSNTRYLVYDIWKQIAYLSQAFTLESGDLIATGTPEGVAVGMESPLFLQPGDVVRCEVEGIGAISNRVRPAAPDAGGN